MAIKASAEGIGWTGTRAAFRYAAVLAVWCGVFLLRPALALEILRERRPDSPLPRCSGATWRLEPAWPAP